MVTVCRGVIYLLSAPRTYVVPFNLSDNPILFWSPRHEPFLPRVFYWLLLIWPNHNEWLVTFFTGSQSLTPRNVFVDFISQILSTNLKSHAWHNFLSSWCLSTSFSESRGITLPANSQRTFLPFPLFVANLCQFHSEFNANLNCRSTCQMTRWFLFPASQLKVCVNDGYRSLWHVPIKINSRRESVAHPREIR